MDAYRSWYSSLGDESDIYTTVTKTVSINTKHVQLRAVVTPIVLVHRPEDMAKYSTTATATSTSATAGSTGECGAQAQATKVTSSGTKAGDVKSVRLLATAALMVASVAMCF